jgi:hypothetical protein
VSELHLVFILEFWLLASVYCSIPSTPHYHSGVVEWVGDGAVGGSGGGDGSWLMRKRKEHFFFFLCEN